MSVLGLSLITEHVETFYLFSLRTEACAQFEPVLNSSLITKQVETLYLTPP